MAQKTNSCVATPLSIAIHYKTVNPIFGEGVTHVRLEDEAAGPFIILSQEGVELRFDMEELEKIIEVARGLIKGYPKDV